jgi:hypothetical protein
MAKYLSSGSSSSSPCKKRNYYIMEADLFAMGGDFKGQSTLHD